MQPRNAPPRRQGAAANQKPVSRPPATPASASPAPLPRPRHKNPERRRTPQSQTVSFILDAATANIALFAIAGHAGEREAHLREVQRHAQDLPEGSYGRRNRQAIAARETRIAARLRAVEQAYRTAIDRDATSTPSEPSRALRSAELQPGRQTGLEAEP